MMKLNRAIVASLLTHAGVIKEAQQKGGAVQIARDPMMRCFDKDTTPAVHRTKITGYGWQVVKGGEVIRQGYVTPFGRVIEVKKSKGGESNTAPLITEQKALPFGGSWSSQQERFFGCLVRENYKPFNALLCIDRISE